MKSASPPVPQRIVDLESGVVMVVTDLHGDGALYQRYRDVFLHLRSRGLARTLVFTGDLIHSEGPASEDASLAIVRDLMRLQRELGPALVVLLGNHEMPHIYHTGLVKGDRIYTARFEAAMDAACGTGTDREAILRFLDGLPFYVRTAAGVTLSHAGAFPEATDPGAVDALRTLSHAAILDEVAADATPEERPALRAAIGELSQVSYDELARTYLAITGPDDLRYDDYLIGVLAGFRPGYKLLWSALFSRNEHESGMQAYRDQIAAFLAAMSRGFARQSVLVTGHIGCRGGHRVLPGKQQIRVASGAHAHPYASARYLLFDAAKGIDSARDLLPGLGSVFTNDPPGS